LTFFHPLGVPLYTFGLKKRSSCNILNSPSSCRKNFPTRIINPTAGLKAKPGRPFDPSGQRRHRKNRFRFPETDFSCGGNASRCASPYVAVTRVCGDSAVSGAPPRTWRGRRFAPPETAYLRLSRNKAAGMNPAAKLSVTRYIYFKNSHPCLFFTLAVILFLTYMSTHSIISTNRNTTIALI